MYTPRSVLSCAVALYDLVKVIGDQTLYWSNVQKRKMYQMLFVKLKILCRKKGLGSPLIDSSLCRILTHLTKETIFYFTKEA